MTAPAPLSPPTPRTLHVARDALGPLVVALAAVTMIAWTWRYCPDPVIDFGREIYIPWRMADGQVLYRDLNYFDGPLGPYAVTLALKVLGVSLDALKLFNASVVVLVALMVYTVVRETSDRIAATAAGVTFAVAFACAQVSGDASFNWLTPYSHNLAYGVALSVAMVACLGRAARRDDLRWLAAAGALLGLVALTKAEVLLAAVVAAVVGIVAFVWTGRTARRRAVRAVVAFVVAAAVPVTLAVALLAAAMPVADALAGVAGAWKFLGNRELMGMTYFGWMLGTDHPERNLFAMLAWAGRYGAVVLAALLLARAVGGREGGTVTVFAVAAFVVTLAALAYVAPRVAWAQAARPLPLLLAAIGAGLLLRVLRPRGRDPRFVLPLTLAALALALLAKSILRTNLAHYGFALAMPGMMVVIAALFGWFPRMLGRGGAPSPVARGVVLAAWLVFIGSIVRAGHAQMSNRVYPVGQGRDRFLADERGRIVNEAIQFLRPHAGETLVAIPDAPLLNYLARMPGPVRYHNFLPPEVVMFGEDRMLAALRASPPQWVGLVHADTRIYDAQYFGRDYAKQVARWVDENYEPAHLSGAAPYAGNAFGILIMKRRPTAADVDAPTQPSP